MPKSSVESYGDSFDILRDHCVDESKITTTFRLDRDFEHDARVKVVQASVAASRPPMLVLAAPVS